MLDCISICVVFLLKCSESSVNSNANTVEVSYSRR